MNDERSLDAKWSTDLSGLGQISRVFIYIQTYIDQYENLRCIKGLAMGSNS